MCLSQIVVPWECRCYGHIYPIQGTSETMQLNWPCLYMRLSPTLLILGVRLGYQCTLLESILNYKLMIRRQLSHLNHYFFQLHTEHLFVIIKSKERISWQTYVHWHLILISVHTITKKRRCVKMARKSAGFTKK